MANAPVDTSPDRSSKKRKLSENAGPELEIDVSLPEPPSKKDLRKLKKLKSKGVDTDTLTSLNVPLIDRSKKGAQEGEAPANGTSSKRSPYGIWIGNLSFNTTREDLMGFFTRGSEEGDNKQDGEGTEVSGTGIRQKDITRLHLPKSTKFKNQNKGFAYVDFLTAGCISHALNLSEKLFNGRKVLIKASTDFNGRPEEDKSKKGEQGSINSGTNPPCRSIFVGNLGYEVTEQEILRHFSPAGKIKKVRFMTFEDSGKCKGFSWVDFEELKSAENVFAGNVEGGDDSEDEKEDEDNKDSSEGESASDDEEQPKKKRKTAKKQKKRKTNPYAFMGNRRLRLEYGEDSTTRYKKRFGDGKGDANGKPEKAGPSHKKPSRDGPARKEAKEPQRELTTEEKQAKNVESRLTGRIVEGTGKKITFD
ncbi:hypothetical protein TWF481_010792 [Arthrobotrys musiformis]|uniref:RRM domain-containing protein n=1 Tax=Arthrobotrys musiformis TaxID=47236 RepID=A0AAV9W333_9PEZI